MSFVLTSRELGSFGRVGLTRGCLVLSGSFREGFWKSRVWILLLYGRRMKMSDLSFFIIFLVFQGCWMHEHGPQIQFILTPYAVPKSQSLKYYS